MKVLRAIVRIWSCRENNYYFGIHQKKRKRFINLMNECSVNNLNQWPLGETNAIVETFPIYNLIVENKYKPVCITWKSGECEYIIQNCHRVVLYDYTFWIQRLNIWFDV